jgi:hypothetical protein
VIAAKFRRMQARHRVNQFYVFETKRTTSVTSAAQAGDGAGGALDALKQAAGPREDRAGGLSFFSPHMLAGE